MENVPNITQSLMEQLSMLKRKKTLLFVNLGMLVPPPFLENMSTKLAQTLRSPLTNEENPFFQKRQETLAQLAMTDIPQKEISLLSVIAHQDQVRKYAEFCLEMTSGKNTLSLSRPTT